MEQIIGHKKYILLCHYFITFSKILYISDINNRIFNLVHIYI